MVGKFLKNSVCLLTAALLVVPMASAQVRNPDGEVGRAVFEAREGWSRVTNPVMDSNGSLTNVVLGYPLNENLSWRFIWDYTRQFEDNDNIFATGLRYFSRPIGAGVDMNPDGAVGSVVFTAQVGYWRPNFSWHGPSLIDITKIVDAIGHGVHASGDLAFPLMTHATLSFDGEVNIADVGSFGVDTYRIYGGGGALQLYSSVLTYDDAQANPDGPVGSMGFEIGGGFRRIGGFNSGRAHGELGMPLNAWATLLIRYDWVRGSDARATIWSQFFTPKDNLVNPLGTWPVDASGDIVSPVNNTSQLSVGFRFY